MLEFAFVMTFLMTLLLAIISFSRAYNVYQTITRAAREGARMAVLPTCATCGNSYMDPSTGVTQQNSEIFSGYIAPALRAAYLNPDSVSHYSETVGWLDSGDADQQCGVTIAFDYPYDLRLPFAGWQFATLNLSTTVQMRRENQPTGTSCP